MDTRSQRFAFTHVDTVNDRRIDFSVSFEEGQAHDEVVSEFLNFLSGVYGYNLRDSYGVLNQSLEKLKAQEECPCGLCGSFGGTD